MKEGKMKGAEMRRTGGEQNNNIRERQSGRSGTGSTATGGVGRKATERRLLATAQGLVEWMRLGVGL